MKTEPAVQIKEMLRISRRRLVHLWKAAYGKEPSAKLRREIMIPFLAYRIQETAYGGLSPSTRAELRRIVRTLKGRGNGNGKSVAQSLKPGIRISRRWHGELHEIFVSDLGYEYKGETYRSLSEIARRITGTCWSGPAFFGINRKQKVRDKSHDQ